MSIEKRKRGGRGKRSPAMTLAMRYGQGWVILTAAIGWGLSVFGGLLALHIHAAAPGDSGTAVEHWPGNERVPLAGDRYTLIMAVHPRCPCTRASVSELAHVLSRCKDQVEAYVFIFTPEHPDRTWRCPEWLRRLGTIRGVHLMHDPGGALAARFGARTSGHVALYAPNGLLVFRGGITRGRGHEGDNAGRQALLGQVSGDLSACPAQTLVFGCPIVEPALGTAGGGSTWIN